MMAGAAVQHLHVHVCARPDGEAFKEIVNELGLKVADSCRTDLQVDHSMRASTEVDGSDCQRLVHRHDEVARAIDPAAPAERARDPLAERDPEIFDRVMLIDVEIAGRVNPKIERAVARDQLQHVIEESDARAHAVASLAVEGDDERDRRLGRPPVDYSAAHSTSSITSMKRRVCSTMPVETRIQPAQPGSVDRSRM